MRKILLPALCLIGSNLGCDQGVPTPPETLIEFRPTPYRMPPQTVVARWQGGTLDYETLFNDAPTLKRLRDRYLRQLHDLERRAILEQSHNRLLKAQASKNQDVQEMLRQKLEFEAPTEEEVTAKAERLAKALGLPPQHVKPLAKRQLEARKRRDAEDRLYESLSRTYKLEIDLEAPKLLMADFELKGRPSRGPEGASFTIVELSDYLCMACSRTIEPLERLLAEGGDQVRYTYLHFPLDEDPDSLNYQAAIAVECAHQQGRFFDMHKAVFAAQIHLQQNTLTRLATELGLDLKTFEECQKGPAAPAQVANDRAQGVRAAVESTPSFFVNGEIPRPGLMALDYVRENLE